MKTLKRLLAFALVLAMILSIAPFAFAEEDSHPSYGSVSVGDKENLAHYFNTKNHYYKNDAESCTDDPEGANVSYDRETGIMVLNNFNGGTIRFNDYGDVTIIVKGTNTIKGYQFGIYANYGNLTITSEENAVLNITASTDDSGGIITSWNSSTDNDITISGNLSVNINTSVDGDFDGIRAGGKLSIIDNANVSVKCTSDVNYSHVYGLKGASLLLDTTGSVSVETECVKYYSFALTFNTFDIKKVKEFKIKSTGSDRTCIIYNEEAYNSLINAAGFEVSLDNDEGNYYLTLAKHIHKFNNAVTAPKANALGYTTYTCACGYSYKDSYTAPTGKPAGVKCAARTAAAEKIAWNKIAGVSGYQVQVSNAAGNKWGSIYNAKTATSYTLSKLTAGSNYKFRVRFYIKAGDGKNYFSQWSAVLASPTLPKATSITSMKSPRSKTVGVYWSKVAGISGYQIQIASSSNFKKNLKTVVTKSSSKSAVFKTKLKGGTRCYIRIRTFKSIGGKNYYSNWCAAKSVVIKK